MLRRIAVVSFAAFALTSAPALAYTDSFDGPALDPSWQVNAFDGTGSASVANGSLTVTNAGVGDFWVNSDTGTAVMRQAAPAATTFEVDLKAFDPNSAYPRLFALRASTAANAAFVAILMDGDKSHVTVVWRDSAGASAAWPGDDSGKPRPVAPSYRLRLELSADRRTVTAAMLPQGSANWVTVGQHTVATPLSVAALLGGGGSPVTNSFDNYSESFADADGDGVADSADNCPTTSNAGQADLDGDGKGDVCDPTPDGLIGHWTFDSAAQPEITGNWASLVRRGNSTIANGELSISSSGSWASADGYSGPLLGDKTLVAWVRLDDLSATAGSPLSLMASNENFDAIVYSEPGSPGYQPNRWMAGSDYFRRTQGFGGAADTATGTLRQVLISYKGTGSGNQTITGCLNGVQLGQYTVNNTQGFSTANGVRALFGPRHVSSGGGISGALNAHIAEARVHSRAIPCEQALSTAPAPDDDGDGVPSTTDNCPGVANADQANLDGDARGDVCDSDIDGDGVANGDDAFPRDATESSDADGDGVGDNADNCPSVGNAGQDDLDGDGQGDACDADIDGDGVANGDDSHPLDGTKHMPTGKDQCKNDGWKTFFDGTSRFKNQGDCVSYVSTNGRNQPVGTR